MSNDDTSPIVRYDRYLDIFDSAGRKKVPMFSGLIAYFPDACAAVAEHSQKGNDKHNPGEALHHARGKSMDHTDCIMRHLENYKGMDGDCMEVVALAWRAMALAQETLERKFGLTLPEGVTDPRAFNETNSLVGPNGEQAPLEVGVASLSARAELVRRAISGGTKVTQRASEIEPRHESQG